MAELTDMQAPRFAIVLRMLGACDSAVEYAESFETAQEAWDACDTIDWMLWLAVRAGLRDQLRRVAEKCIAIYADCVAAGLEPLAYLSEKRQLRYAKEAYTAGSYAAAVLRARLPIHFLEAVTEAENPCNVLRKHIPIVPTEADVQAFLNDQYYREV